MVVDDGSSDPSTLNLLRQLESDGVSVVHQENRGQAGAAMTGVRATSAPYVMRFDADDTLVPGAVATLADALDESGEAAVAWGDIYTFGLTSFRIPSAPTLDPWLLTYTNCLPAGGALFRRAALAEVGGWQLPTGFEDWDLWMALAERGHHGVYVPEVIYRYRRNTSGRHAESLPDAGEFYEQLKHRHQTLFASRKENRRHSQAPHGLKLAVTVIDALPRLPRLTRIHLCELLTHLLWNGGIRMTSNMVWQAIAIRVRRR